MLNCCFLLLSHMKQKQMNKYAILVGTKLPSMKGGRKIKDKKKRKKDFFHYQ